MRIPAVLSLVALCAATLAAPPSRTGTATWYGPGFHGRRTASGERYDMNRATCASRHKEYFGHTLRITNLANGRKVTVRCNDRGGYGLVDLSRHAMRAIGGKGKAQVRVEVLK